MLKVKKDNVYMDKAKVSVILLEIGNIKTDYYTVKRLIGGCYAHEDAVVHPLSAAYCAGVIGAVKQEVSAIRTANLHAIECNWFFEDKMLRVAVSLQGNQSATKQIVKCMQNAVLGKTTIALAT